MNVLTIDGLSKSYGDRVLFDNVSFNVNSEDKIGLIGVNGTGKSTLLKIICNIESSDKGTISTMKNIRIEYLSQTPDFNAEATILEQVYKDNPKDMQDVELWEYESQAKTILTKLGIHDFERRIGTLSGGQKKRVALAAALIAPCDLLILDEPTNHMDSDTIGWLERYLMNRKGALIMITHDRYFLDRVVNKTLELYQGTIYTYTGNYTEFIEKKLERQDIMEASERKKANLYRRELAWIKRGAKARSTKQKSRIDRFEQLKDSMDYGQDAVLDIPVGNSRLGNTVIELENISKSFKSVDILSDYSYTLLRDDRIGIVGDNGKGKSTLLNILVGKLKPDQGLVRIGSTVKIGYFSQESELMDENLTAIDYIKETAEYMRTADGESISASKMMEVFLFDSNMQHTYIHRLSGGEKRRLFLLKILMNEPNVLILDEPTNDFDIDTLKVLESYIDGFSGAVVTVSHDRYFLDRTCKRIFAFTDKQTVEEYMGNYTDYLSQFSSKGKTKLKATVQAKQEHHENLGNSEDKKEAIDRKKRENPKLSYNEKQEFEMIDQEIERLEDRLETIEKTIRNNPTDYTLLQEMNEETEIVEMELLEKLERQEYLNEKDRLSKNG